MNATTQIPAGQLKTLRTLVAQGGEMNAYAGQRGFDLRGLDSLERAGAVERVADCAACASSEESFVFDGTCERPLTGQKGGGQCYSRVRVTDAGRELAAGGAL